MTADTIKKLNQLNQDFYSQIADEFNQTRQQPWSGWTKLPLFLNLTKTTLIDLGCGNGRLGVYLAEHGLKKYYGFDTNEKLLKEAMVSLKLTTVDHHLFHSDLIYVLQHLALFQTLTTAVSSTINQPTAITLFGVLHHIPSQELRQKLFEELAAYMKSSDRLIVSCWQFQQSKNLWSRRVGPQAIGLSESELEGNDYILDWQRGTAAYRYCHLTTQAEINQLADHAQLKIVEHWAADGKTNNLNHYYLLAKKA